MRKNLSAIIVSIFLFACNQREKIDLLVYNATIYTVDSSFSVTDAIAVKDGKIIETGKTGDLQNKFEAIEKIDANGKFIYPGFIDAHAHFVGYGLGLQTVDLVGTESWEDILHRLDDFAKNKNKGQWLIGRGDSWDGHRTRCEYSRAGFPDEPGDRPIRTGGRTDAARASA